MKTELALQILDKKKLAEQEKLKEIEFMHLQKQIVLD